MDTGFLALLTFWRKPGILTVAHTGIGVRIQRLLRNRGLLDSRHDLLIMHLLNYGLLEDLGTADGSRNNSSVASIADDPKEVKPPSQHGYCPNDHRNMRILHSASMAEDKGIPKTMVANHVGIQPETPDQSKETRQRDS